MADKLPPGTIGWIDMTAEHTERVRDFYAAVVGWRPAAMEMDDYDDYFMRAKDGQPVAGICHKQGINADLPPVWLIYIAVEDLDSALVKVEMCGGKVVCPPREAFSRFAVIQDPAGALCALYTPTHVAGEES
jgi:predicted enzyme related to lactoylglutathione lyase